MDDPKRDVYSDFGYGNPDGAQLLVVLKEPLKNPETGGPMILFAKQYQFFRRSSKNGDPAGEWWIQFILNPNGTRIDVKEDNVAYIKNR